MPILYTKVIVLIWQKYLSKKFDLNKHESMRKVTSIFVKVYDFMSNFIFVNKLILVRNLKSIVLYNTCNE